MSDDRDTVSNGAPPSELPKTVPPPPPDAEEAAAVAMDPQMTAIVRILTRIEGKVDAIQSSCATLTNEQQKIRARQTRIEKRVGKLEKEVARLRTMLPPPPEAEPSG